VPLPVPLEPEVIESQELLLPAVHVQFAAEAVTVTLPVEPSAGNELVVYDNVKEQPS
jgi:hypothetical protein